MNIDDLPVPDYTSLSDEELQARIIELRMKRRQAGVQVKQASKPKSPKKQRQEARGFTPEQARTILAALMAAGQVPSTPIVEDQEEDEDAE